MSKYLNFNSPIFKILLLFLLWRIGLVLVSFLAISFVPLGSTDRFLGGGAVNYLLAPYLFSWANFDGEHYLSIAIFGYNNLQQAFFPVYPLLISLLAKPFSQDLLSSLVNFTTAGLIISNGFFVIALVYLYNLIRIDFPQRVAYLVIILLLIFPTSFYFGSVYNESLFLFLSVIAFIFARKGNWFLASIFGMAASATRLFGIFLFPAFIIEVYLQKDYKRAFWILLIPLGLGGYMYYQYLTVGDPLAFYNLQDLVGEQRQSTLVALPQVYYRYIKMLTSVNIYQPIYQTILLEFIVSVVFLILLIYGYIKKIRLSYLLYVFLGFIITTVQGSFSSVPRYVLIFFPSFLALALWVDRIPIFIKGILFIILVSLLIAETMLFLRGYWIA